MDSSLCILVAEDNDNDAFLIQRAFKNHGLVRPPYIVEDGAEAIAYIAGEARFSDRLAFPFPNLLILDLKMPRVDGFQVLEWLKDHPDFRVVPTIIWSASVDLRDVKHAYCLGANGYLCKPSDFGEFERKLGRLLAFWEDCEKLPPPTAEFSCDPIEDRHHFTSVHKDG